MSEKKEGLHACTIQRTTEDPNASACPEEDMHPSLADVKHWWEIHWAELDALLVRHPHVVVVAIGGHACANGAYGDSTQGDSVPSDASLWTGRDAWEEEDGTVAMGFVLGLSYGAIADTWDPLDQVSIPVVTVFHVDMLMATENAVYTWQQELD